MIDYIAAYTDYVDMVYKTFKPFDYETGEGIVVAAPKEGAASPVRFPTNKLPDLGKIWSAQERLWIQRTLLEVVAQVNKNAKDWDCAIIRQIEAIEVGNPIAQDQRSLAKGDQLEEAPNRSSRPARLPRRGRLPAPAWAEAGVGGAGMDAR